MDRLFEKALRLVRDLSSYEDLGGMASITVCFDPYKSRWEAFADWSGDKRLTADPSESVTDAIVCLIDVLRDEKARRKGT